MFSKGFVSLIALAAVVNAQQGMWQQCGGFLWHGPTTCVSGAVCHRVNDWYSHCRPGSGPTSSENPSLTPSPSSTSSNPPQPSHTLPAHISPEWTAAYAKASPLVERLTLEEKVSLATGVGWMEGHCVGNIAPVPSINFPGLCLDDGPLGIRFADLISAFPAVINLGATFNRTLARKYGEQLGAEFRGKGVNIALGPMMNIARAPAAGRNWEGFGSDPYLSGEGAYEYILGLQSNGVQATAKHYINNEQEHFRETSSSVVDDRTQHELYAAPFLRSVQANVANIMCAYNQINGSYACENDKTLNGILKGEFGFPGVVLSDWWATHSTTSVNKGLDMNMPGNKAYGVGGTWFGEELINAVNSGEVPESRIDDMALRILAAWLLLGQDQDFPETNFHAWDINDPFNKHVDVQANHKELIREIGAASTVLLKNNKNTLPLKRPRSLAIIGSHAGPSSRGPNGYADRGGNEGVLAMGWGSGTCEFPYLVTPLESITERATAAGTSVTSALDDNDLDAAAAAAAGKDVALVFITSDSGEAYITVEGNAGDRNNLSAWHNGDNLVLRVASVNSRTVVVVNTVGPIIMEPWINHPNVTAVVWSGLPGQEAGNSVTEILYGDYNPSGRLPYTIGKSVDDYSTKVIYQSNSPILEIPYNDGLFVDYRHFDRYNIEPRFEFGFGLSYTTYRYNGISVRRTGSIKSGLAPSSSSLDPWLHEKVARVTFTLRNSGSVAGHEIPQLYLSLPHNTNSPPRVLRGFDSVYLTPRQSKTVTFELSRYDLSIWDVRAQRWRIPSGKFGFAVGASSRDIRLNDSFSL